MPISVQTPIIEHVPNGVTTVFAYPFAILDAEDLKAQLDGAPFTAFTVSGVGSRTGGSITCTSAPTGSSLILYREISLARATDYQELGDLLAETLDDDFDRAWMAIQDLGAVGDRSIRVPVGEALDDLPAAASRMGRVLGFDPTTGQPVMITRTEDGGSALAFDLLNKSDATKGPGMVGLNATLNYVAGTIGARLREVISVTDFPWLADKTGVNDSTAAIQAALDHASANRLDVEAHGLFRADNPIYVRNGVGFTIGRMSQITRTAASASTEPVIYVLDSFSELRGGQVMSNNASPNGVVCLGHMSATDNRNAWNWRFHDCRVIAQNNAGDIAVHVPSGQVTYPSKANYFGFISNIAIYGGDIGLLLAEQANAHNISNLQFWHQSTACLRLRGAYGNNISNFFCHESAANGCIGVHLANKTASTQESTWNDITGFTVETGNPSDRSVVIDSNALANRVIGGSNVGGGYTKNNDNNFVVISSQLKQPSIEGQMDVFADSSANALRVLGRSSDNVGNLNFYSNDKTTLYGLVQGRPSDFRVLANGARPLTFYVNGNESFRSDTSNNLAPGSDNVRSCGTGALRWSVVYAGTGAINTSDERAKQQIQSVDEAVLRAWGRVSYSQFKFNDAVAQKGDGARWHFGLIAQRVKEAFESEGLDAFEYGLLCYDEWDDEFEPVTDEEGTPVLNSSGDPEMRLRIAAGDRYGIRYEEALALECAYLRSRIAAN